MPVVEKFHCVLYHSLSGCGVDKPQALARVLSPVQADKLLIPSSVKTLLSMKYFVLKFAISGKGGVSK